MKFRSKSCYGWLLAVLMLIGASGCAHEPFDPPETGEIPKGPGVFSKGDDGVVLFDSNKKKAPAVAAPSPESTGEKTAVPEDTRQAYEEFEAYQQWLEWKKSNADTDDYQEFKQWQEWRRYQEWKKKK